MKFCLLILTLSVFCFSCTIKKRSYRNGYYLDLVSKKTDRKTPSSTVVNFNCRAELKSKTKIEQVIVPSNEVLASAGNTMLNTSFLLAPTNLLPPDSCADMIYFQDGTEVQAKIIAINQNDVEYTRCDQTNTSIIKVKKKKVLMLKFANGLTESFQSAPESLPLVPKVHPKAKAAMVEAIIALVLFPLGYLSPIIPLLLITALILGICAGIRARKKIRASPDKYKGLKFANAALIICFTLSVILIALTLLLLFLFLIW